MWRTEEGSSGRLLQLCIAYYVLYTIYSVLVKYFQAPAALGFPGMSEAQFSVYSTIGGTGVCAIAVILLGWYRLESNRKVKLGPFQVPSEYSYIIPSGVCTAVIVPTTTLMYSLPISVMVAMVIMRGSVIVISRIVDAIQLRQGILKRKVYLEENLAVVFALLAVAVALLVNVLTGKPVKPNPGALSMAAGMFVLLSYVAAYAIRIYIMNYFKNTRGKGVKLDNNGFFGVEQLSTAVTAFLVGLFLYFGADLVGWEEAPQIVQLQGALSTPLPFWHLAVAAGTVFGFVAFFSVFIFMFKGRTATFAGLVNRLTSLIAGTTATLASYYLDLGGKAPPKLEDWASLGFILIAVGFLTRAERRRAAESIAPVQEEAPAAPNRALA